jgi:acyl-coenzyme A thioesterase PaaI-like protein
MNSLDDGPGTAREAPPGYSFIQWPSPYVRHIGAPLYQKYHDDGRRTVGTWLGPNQCNRQGYAHGGFLLTLADFAVTYGRFEAGEWGPNITLQLGAEFIGPAKQGDWIEARTRIFKKSSSLVFAEVHLYVGDAIIVRASGVCRPVPEPGSEKKR